MSARTRVAILSLEQPGSACDQIRLRGPLAACDRLIDASWALKEQGARRILQSKQVELADLIVVQRFFPYAETAAFIEELLACGTPVIYEVDDLLPEITDRNPNRMLSCSSGPHIVRLMRRAAAVVVSTPQLASYFDDLNPSIHVLPNLVDTALFRALPRQKKPFVHVLFAGTGTHLEDLELVEPALLQLHAELGDRVRFTFMGCVTRLLATLPGCELRELEPSYATYACYLSQADVDLAIVPLRDHRFNRCKSDIKWLEYSACGIPGIYSRIEPYTRTIEDGQTGWLVPNTTEAWLAALREAIAAPALREEIAHHARAAVLGSRTLERSAHVYGQFYAGMSARAPRPPALECSIVIPVYGRLDCTQQCLTALLSSNVTSRAEIIVVDDGSSDGTAAYLESLGSRIRTLRQPANRGFAAACNAGAAIARAPLLLFLNNDTLPSPGWLDPLLDELGRSDRVSVVGALLLYPDRRIQHAGVAFSVPDGVPYNLYRGAPEGFAPASQRRELAAVTGACMLVRRRTFRAIGGFDERYRNGFEDVDLCLRIRARNERIVYQPASCVVHLEEQSEGRKAHDTENLQRFLERWSHPALPDEIAVLIEAGLAVHSAAELEPGTGRSRRLAPIRDAAEWESWNQAACVSRAIASSDWESLRKDPPVAARWPADVAVLQWGERVCRHAGLSDAAAAFAARCKELSLSAR